MIQHLTCQRGPWNVHHHCAHHLVRSPWLHAPQYKAQPWKGKRTGYMNKSCSFSHHLLSCTPQPPSPLARPNILSYPMLLTNLFSLFFASFLSSVSADSIFLTMLHTTCFLMQGTDFSHGLCMLQPQLQPLRFTSVHAWAVPPRTHLLLLPSHSPFTSMFQQQVTGLSLGCLLG